MDEREKPLDDALGALYRALPREGPPPAVDAAVLAAARESAEPRTGRRWAAPVALAAVLVLSIGVTLRISEERPETRELQPAPPSPRIQAPPQTPPPAMNEANAPARLEKSSPRPAAKPESIADAGPRPPTAPSPAQDASVASRASERESAPAAEERAAASPGFVPSPRADSSQPAPSAAQAVPAAPAAARAPTMAKSAAAESTLGSAAARTPEQWIEQIAAMRAQGRHKEADESYAEFRRQFPDYALAPEVLHRIAPPR